MQHLLTLIYLTSQLIIFYLRDNTFLILYFLYTIILFYQLRNKQQPSSYNLPAILSSSYRCCTICQRYKPPRYYHCSRCRYCLYRMDHHCMWLGKCIAHYNMKIYSHFLGHVFGSGVYVLICCLTYIGLFFSGYNLGLNAIVLPTVLAVYQSGRLLNDFKICLLYNQTLVYSLKGVYGKKQHWKKTGYEYFGDNWGWKWFVPIEAKLDRCELEENVRKEYRHLLENISVSQQAQLEELDYEEKYFEIIEKIVEISEEKKLTGLTKEYLESKTADNVIDPQKYF